MLLIYIVLFCIFWVACGILHFGLWFAYLQRKWPNIAEECYLEHRRWTIIASALGPIALITGYSLSERAKYGLQFKRLTTHPIFDTIGIDMSEEHVPEELTGSLELKYKKMVILLLSRIMADTYDGKGSPSHHQVAKMADTLMGEIDVETGLDKAMGLGEKSITIQ